MVVLLINAGSAWVFGYWPFLEEQPVRIDTASSMFNAPGDDDPAEEYVCLVNQADEPVDLLGWVLRDGAGRDVNTLPDFTLAPEAHVRVHPGKGRNSTTDLFGTGGSPVWTNGGDSVTLLDADGQEIDSQSYGPRDDNEAAGRCSD